MVPGRYNENFNDLYATILPWKKMMSINEYYYFVIKKLTLSYIICILKIKNLEIHKRENDPMIKYY